MTCGVYAIQNTITGDVYIGSTIRTFEQRWAEHLEYAPNPYFEAAQKKYGWENFDFFILEEYPSGTTTEIVRAREDIYINIFKTLGMSYNLNTNSFAPTMKGKKHTEEWKQAMSDRQRGREKSAEHRAALSEAQQRRFAREAERPKMIVEPEREIKSQAKSDGVRQAWARRKAEGLPKRSHPEEQQSRRTQSVRLYRASQQFLKTFE